MFKTVAAFANTEGGIMLFGVGDDGATLGIADKLQDARSRMNDLVRDLISPSPQVTIEGHRYDGKNILILGIEPSAGIVHALTIDKNKPEYYVRRDGTTFHAQPNEISAIVGRGMNSQTRPRWLGYG